MSTITLDPNNTKPQSINQLGTYTYTVPAASIGGAPVGAGMITVSFAAQLTPVSGLTITIQQNGVTKASAAAPARSTTPTTGVSNAGAGVPTTPVFNQIGQFQSSLSVLLNCAPSDTISVILASALDHDLFLNDIQGILNIRQGQV